MADTPKQPTSTRRLLLLTVVMLAAGFAVSWLFATPAVRGAQGAGLQAYSWVFSPLVAIAFVLLAWWLALRPKGPVVVFALSIVVAHLSGVAAYLLSPVFVGETPRLLNSVKSIGFFTFAAVALSYPLLLGGWLFALAAAFPAIALSKSNRGAKAAV